VFLENPPTSRLGGSAALVYLGGYAMIAGWYVTAWGAFSRLYEIGRRRSLLAFSLAVAFSAVKLLIVYLVGSALSPFHEIGL
jgi:hypothetical protein